MDAGNDHFVIIGCVVHDGEFLSGGLTKGVRMIVIPTMPASRHFLPVCVSAAATGGSSDVGKSFIKLAGNLHPTRAVFNPRGRNSRLPLARLKLDWSSSRPGPASYLEHQGEQVLARIFHNHDSILERNIRLACGQSDYVAANPNEIGPIGRRFRTSGSEIFGLGFVHGKIHPGDPRFVHPGEEGSRGRISAHGHACAGRS